METLTCYMWAIYFLIHACMKQYTLGLGALALAFVLVGGGCSSPADTDDQTGAMMDDGGGQAMMDDGASTDTMMASLGECPSETSLVAVENSLSDFAAAGPFDLATFTDAKASYDTGNDKNLKVYIANKDFPIGALRNAFVSPVKDEAKGTAVVGLTFYGGDEKAGPGVYDPTKKYNEAGLVSGEIRVPNDNGTGSSLSFYFTEGTATVMQVQDGKVCGTLNLSGNNQKLEGTFVATLE